MMRFLLPLLLIFCYNSYSQSVVHYVGPVHSNEKNTLSAKQQYIYITSPYQDGPVYVKISKFGVFETEVFTMEKGRSISYRVGDDSSTPLVILTEDLGENLSDKGMKVEGFRDPSMSNPIQIFVETRFGLEATTQMYSCSTQAGTRTSLMSLTTAALVKMGKKITHIYGGTGYGMIYK